MRFFHVDRPYQILPLARSLQAENRNFQGHWFPLGLPFYSPATLRELSALSYQERSYRILCDISEESFNKNLLADWVPKVFKQDFSITHMQKNLYFAELFHGETGNSEDIVARWVQCVLKWIFKENGPSKRPLFVYSTTGQSGIPLAHRLQSIQGLTTLMFFPKNRLTMLQEKALESTSDSIVLLEVDGTYDDCMKIQQRFVKDPDILARNTLYSSDASPIGIVPYGLMFLELSLRFPAYKLGQFPSFSIPAGRFHLASAAILARILGGYIGNFLFATVSDTVPYYLAENKWVPQAYHESVLGSILDVMDPPYWRLLEKGAFRGNIRLLRSLGFAHRVEDDSIRSQMISLYRDYEYLASPDGAVASYAYQTFGAKNTEETPSVVLMPTHPAYFEVLHRYLLYAKVSQTPTLFKTEVFKELIADSQTKQSSRKIPLPADPEGAVDILKDLTL